MLAGIAKSPREYSPTADDKRPVLRRRNQILLLMGAHHFLAPEQLKAAGLRPLSVFARHAPPSFRSSAVVEHVLDELEGVHAQLGIDDLLQGRLQVYSTVDAGVQRLASEALEHGIERYEGRHPKAAGIVQGSVVVLKNRDGSILAEVGGRQVYRGRSTAYSDFNRVRESLRQPGSAMKPLVYLAAFESGHFSLETLVPDEPISVPNGNTNPVKWIANYDGRFKGLIPVRTALAESRNAVAVWMTAQIGIDALLRTSRSLGIQTPLHPYLTTALGASEVNLLELASAYRAIASGVVAAPHVIQSIALDGSDPVVSPRVKPRPIGDAALVLIQEGLRGVVVMPTGTAHALASRSFPLAVMGKTGTTNDFRDALFVGSTYGLDGITVAVRIGYDDNRSLGQQETGGRVALPVFRELMLGVYRDGLVGPAPVFPAEMEERIMRSLQDGAPAAGEEAISVRAVPAGDGAVSTVSNITAGR